MTEPSSIPPSNITSGHRTASSIFFQLLTDLTRMPRWHKVVLGAALATVLFGWGHRIYHALADSNLPPASVAATQQAAPAARSVCGF